MTDATVATLREPSQQLRAVRERIKVSEQQEQESRREEQRLQQQLESRLQSLGQSNLGTAVQRLQETGRPAEGAIELDHRAARLQRKLKETRKESHHWIQRQIPSWRGLMVLGAVFTMGVVVVLVGLFGSRFGVTEDRRGLMALVGGAISLASVVMKNVSEFAANRNLSSCRDEMESLQKPARVRATRSGRASAAITCFQRTVDGLSATDPRDTGSVAGTSAFG